MAIGALLACNTIDQGLFKNPIKIKLSDVHIDFDGSLSEAARQERLVEEHKKLLKAQAEQYKQMLIKLLLSSGETEAKVNIVSNVQIVRTNIVGEEIVDVVPLSQCTNEMIEKGTVIKTYAPGYSIDTNYKETCLAMKQQLLAVSAMQSSDALIKFKKLKIPFRSIECDEESVQAKQCIHHLFMFALTKRTGVRDELIGDHMVDTFSAFHKLNLFPQKDNHFDNVAMVLLMLQCTGRLCKSMNINKIFGLSNSWQSSYFPEDANRARVLQSQMKLVTYFVAMASYGQVSLQLIAKIMTCHASLLMTSATYAMKKEQDMFKAIEPIVFDPRLTMDDKEQKIHAAMTEIKV